jgi:Leucine-rich repeat (LRR) protein
MSDYGDETLGILDLRNRGLDALPGIERYTKLDRIWLAGNRLTEVPAGLASLPQLAHLALQGNPIATFDDAVAARMRLRSIDLGGTALRTLPPSVAGWPLQQVRLIAMRPDFAWAEALARIDPTSLGSLTLGENPSLASMLPMLERFVHLKVLHLNACAIESVPEAFARLTELETLSFFENSLAELPDAVTTLPSLRSLVITKNPSTRRIKVALKKRGVTYAVT